MITYSEYLDEYVKDLNNNLFQIKQLIFNTKGPSDYHKLQDYILEAEKCIKQINLEINSLPKGSHKIFDEINKQSLELKQYKNILEKMNSDYYSNKFINSRDKDVTKKYIEGVNILRDSEKTAQDVEDMGFTIMSELSSQRDALLRTKHYANETRQEHSRVKRILLSIYNNKLLYKGLLITVVILLIIANIGVIIYKFK
ncbi:vesicle transport v-SNARE protein, putative [Hepatocystis sp. ex Piliocolobus tephrosceles]|nr:vesicle transport v-SNARE protein, putative [Hepatocystis sp. ex Piliocolobus tephrosceles]